MLPSALPIINLFKCPYCGRESEKVEDVQHCHGMCHLAKLIETEMFDPDWRPPLPLNRFKEWTQGDRHEFARRLDFFARKYYLAYQQGLV